MNETAVLNDLKKLSDILSTGKSQTIENKDVGVISVDKGNLGKGGYGLLHIIETRDIRDNLNKDEITAMLYRVVNAAEEGRIVKNQQHIIGGKDIGRLGIEKNGIIAFVSKARGEKDEKFVITGFGLDEKKEEAAEAIRTVIAQYGHSPEFSYIRKQVGATVSSIDKISHKSGEKSSPKTEESEKKKEATPVQAYLDGIEIKNIDDFKYQLKALPMMFPSEFGKDSIKTAKTLFKIIDENTKKTIGNMLTELSCITPERTKQVLDRWAGFGREQKVEKRAQDNGMGR